MNQLELPGKCVRLVEFETTAPLVSRETGAYIASCNYNPNTRPACAAYVPIPLPPPQLLEITGSDAIAFAHAQFTSDVRALAGGHWHWSAWLSPQGRVRAFFRLLRRGDDTLLLLLQGGAADQLRAALAPYVFRSKVALRCLVAVQAWGFERRDDVEACLGVVPGPNDIVMAQTRTGISLTGKDAHWLVLAGDERVLQDDTDGDGWNRWRLAEIKAGIVSVDAAQTDRFLPFWLGLDELGAISVGKGCYPGQEIVARMHFKGGNKRRLYRLGFEAPALPLPGTALHAGGESASGEILGAAWTRPGAGLALAILPLDLAPAPLSAPDLPLASFRVVSPDAGASA